MKPLFPGPPRPLFVPRTRRHALGCVAAWLAWACAGPAQAQGVPEADRRAVRAVIQAQLNALAAGDAEGAFRHAAPAIRSQFGSAEAFMAMVAGSYPMLLAPAETSFFEPQAEGGQVWQQLRLRDRQGRLWRATYPLRRLPGGGEWRIEGCVVEPEAEGTST